MKKLLLLPALFIFCVNAFAQITINSTHMPQGGDTLRYSTAILDTAVLFNFQTPGANLTWNFDSLVPLRQGVREYVASAQTPYSGSITNRIGEKLADTLALGGIINLYDVYNFYSNTTTDFSTDFRGATVPTGLGFPFPPTLAIAQSYSDKDEVYQFPLDYQDRDSSTFQFTYTNALVGAYYGSSGYRINDVDAWGSLKTPYGTFNCIRVVTDIVAYDSVSFGGNNFGFNSHTREYKWLTTQFEIPALTVTGTVVANVFIPTGVQYRDSVRNVPSVFAPIALFAADDLTPRMGDTVNFNNLSISLLNANYEWSITPNTFNYLGGTSAFSDSIVVAFTDTGFYDVQLIAINSSGRDTLRIPNYVYVDFVTGINDVDLAWAEGLKVFPNPAKHGEHFFIGPFEQEKAQKLELIDSKGAVVYLEELVDSDVYVKLAAPGEKGIYYLRVTTSSGIATKKIVIAE